MLGRENIDKWMPQLTTDVLFCADANLNHKTGVCSGDSGGPALQRLKFISFGTVHVQSKVHIG